MALQQFDFTFKMALAFGVCYLLNRLYRAITGDDSYVFTGGMVWTVFLGIYGTFIILLHNFPIFVLLLIGYLGYLKLKHS